MMTPIMQAIEAMKDIRVCFGTIMDREASARLAKKLEDAIAALEAKPLAEGWAMERNAKAVQEWFKDA
jgi:hypothetical protein